MKVQFDRNQRTDKNRQCITICNCGFSVARSRFRRTNFEVRGWAQRHANPQLHIVESVMAQ